MAEKDFISFGIPQIERLKFCVITPQVYTCSMNPPCALKCYFADEFATAVSIRIVVYEFFERYISHRYGNSPLCPLMSLQDVCISKYLIIHIRGLQSTPLCVL